MTESIINIKGVGEKTAALFSKLDIRTTEDLIRYYPADYEKLTSPVSIRELVPGRVCAVEGYLSKDASLNFFNGLKIVNAYISDMTGKLQLSWYNFPYIKNNLKQGSHYVFRGRIAEKNGRLVMQQPKIYNPVEYKNVLAERLCPLYPLTKGLSHLMIRKAVKECFDMRKDETDYFTEEFREKYSLSELNTALRQIHFPASEEKLMSARERLVFDEFFFFTLMSVYSKKENDRRASSFIARPKPELLSFIAGLPYELTEAQLDAYKAIVKDMASGRVMNRLIRGDVGSGKTIVAVLAMLNAALNGFQSAFMAPTEVLAAQHFDTINKLLTGFNTDISCVLITGSMSAKEKRLAYEMTENHEADIIIGTHALIQEKIKYARLGLVVTDEQHRFGVKQREALNEKGTDPHILVMSATPIPRTLALMLYGDLDISEINALPKGRKPVKNCVVGVNYRKRAYSFILDEIKKGRQAYVICPQVEAREEDEAQGENFFEKGASPGNLLCAGEGSELMNVADYAKSLGKIFPENIRIAKLHGEMKAADKEKIMRGFKEHEYDILVSTTVIEVGVDVANATVIMIENAERFGLAQLHQLRGRVGRGSEQSYCIMINSSDSEKSKERLDILNHSNDGFYIASEDLKLRGPGDIFGIRQSGELKFRLGDIYNDAGLLTKAFQAAKAAAADDEELLKPENAGIKRRLTEIYRAGSYA